MYDRTDYNLHHDLCKSYSKIVPILGVVNVQLPKTGDVYQWNKVTTCVHNLFSGQRWVDQYGELRISCSSGISCKLTFVKVNNGI